MRLPMDKFAEYLENKNLKPRTVENYLYYFQTFNFPFNQENVLKFMSKKANRNTIARAFIKNFKAFLLLNWKEFNIPLEKKVEISEVELPVMTGRGKTRIIHPIKIEQIRELYKALEEPRYKIMLLLSYFGGLRVGELLKIKVLSFNWKEWKVNPEAFGECRVYGKGDKEGIALFPPFVMKKVASYIRLINLKNVDDYLFLRNLKQKTEGIVKTEYMERNWERKLREVGIKTGVTNLDTNNKVIEETRVHPHRLRHSYAYYLMKNKGMDIREVQELLRHKSITSTQIYTMVYKDDLKKKLQGKSK